MHDAATRASAHDVAYVRISMRRQSFCGCSSAAVIGPKITECRGFAYFFNPATPPTVRRVVFAFKDGGTSAQKCHEASADSDVLSHRYPEKIKVGVGFEVPELKEVIGRDRL